MINTDVEEKTGVETVPSILAGLMRARLEIPWFRILLF